MASEGHAQTLPAGFYLEDAVDNTFYQPVNMVFAPGGRMFVVEKQGLVWVVQNGELRDEPFIDLRDEVLNQQDRGLLGIVVDPDFASNRRVFLSYVVDHEETADRIRTDAFARVVSVEGREDNPSVADLSTRRILIGETFETGIPSCHFSHSIGSLAIGADGSLLVGAGDGADYAMMDDGGNYPDCFGDGRFPISEDIGAFRSQRLQSLAGKILRIDPVTGRGYPSNPFYTGNSDDAASKVWALGVRNPYRFTLAQDGSPDPAAADPGTLYIGEVGWVRWEELDIVRGGENLGWPCYEGDGPLSAYFDQGDPATNGCGEPLAGTLTGPVYTWHHNAAELSRPQGRVGHAVVMGAHTVTDRYPGVYGDALFYGDYADGWMAATTLDGDGIPSEEHLFSTDTGFISAMAFDEFSRYLYLVDIGRGRIRRLRHSSEEDNPAPVAQARATPAQGGVGVRVHFSPEGSFDPNGDDLTFVWTFSDGTQSDLRAPQKVFTSPGVHTAEVAVSDGLNVDRKTVSVRVAEGEPPAITILSPEVGVLPRAGDTVPLIASISDPDEDAQSLSVRWDVAQIHEAHVHPDVFVSSGEETEFVPADHGVPGEIVYYRIRATVRDASGLDTVAERILMLSGASGEVDITSSATPIARSPSGSVGSLSAIADGVFPERGAVADDAQYQSAAGAGAEEEWVGLAFQQMRRLTRLTFQEGMQSTAGGWWETLRVQVREDGLWRDALGLGISPAYRANDGVSFDTYELSFLPAWGDAVRVIGKSGGSFVTAGELRAWAISGADEIPVPWNSHDVGTPQHPGSSSVYEQAYTLRSGGKIWGQRDAFHFMYQSLPSDGSIIARVASRAGEHDWAKAGLMVRSDLAPEAPNAAVMLSELGLHVQYRERSGHPSAAPVALDGIGAPSWVRLDRRGPTVAAFYSADGVEWQAAGTATVEGLGTGRVLVGLAVSSAESSRDREASATFESVMVTGEEELLPPDLAAPPLRFGIDRVFPNPARGLVTVRAILSAHTRGVLTVVDALGREIASVRIEGAEGVYDVPLDLRRAPAGAYMVWLRDEASGQATTQRLTLVH